MKRAKFQWLRAIVVTCWSDRLLFLFQITRVAGAGTDFAAFLQHVGVPSLDMSYGLCKWNCIWSINISRSCLIASVSWWTNSQNWNHSFPEPKKICIINICYYRSSSWCNIISLAVEEYPVYHSLYDDYVWVERFGDPLFHRHVAGTESSIFSQKLSSLSQALANQFS